MRRNDRPQRPEEEFAAWLDGLVLGQDPPGGETGAGGAEQGAIKATALYAQHVGRGSTFGDAERQRLKEEIMAAIHQPTARLTVDGRRGNERDDVRRARVRWLRPLARVRFSPLVSGAMVALLLVAIVAGYSGMQGVFGPGNGTGQPASVPASSALSAAALPNPQNCDVQPLTNAELQKIVTEPYEQRVNAISKNPVQVDVVDGAAILQVYQQIRDCAVSPNGGDAVFALMSPHAVQEMYWRGVSMSGIFDTRASQPGSVAATPAAPSSAFVWQPNFSKTDTYFAQINVVRMETMKDGRVVAWILWLNSEGQPPAPNAFPPLDGLVFIKIDGQWKLDDWIFGTQILTDAGR